ncbi:hypothetical protein CLAFUW4_09091 [Fulvia fulva]|uniref:RNA polymerase II transcription factor SIII subunit A n=1 Tax=Passalora fulva TaxID=5499 RepID=A0A9Q8PH56_PASFU|nr:uncharacterized protein CLAFUR5_09200 [Fulvia fulva]KAK4614162.1 hypothetical protein CLAFUR4_09097 [Fulvia fulva]KAK4614883.1 hypothetical protein CLAFUR0_09089 [Fulvia fulva]UJO22307.1 hypothetical protein CLAFUR5_09200 [Fulvia fulva]WPV20363.1 hypothetical protein CLAFUW4_09091 [Fulvia fulva]WPV35345.1 hypothetical protein CLAFUW7_09092 [Fulvia fulva]
MPAKTLLNMATATAIRLVSQIDEMGRVPYHLARPILLKIQNPQQLRDFEVANPELAESDAEIWKNFIARDIPDWEKKIIEPKNPCNWHKVYAKLTRAEQRKAEEDEENLRRTLQGETLKKAGRETLFVAKVLPHKREHNTGMVDGVPKSAASGWGASKAPALKNSKTGKDMMAAIRRQTAQATKVKLHSQPQVRTTSSQQLNTAKRQITAAPVSMVQDIARTRKPLTVAPRELLPHEQALMRERQAAQTINRIIPATRKGAAQTIQKNRAVEAAAQKAREEREAKLRALTQKRPATPQQPAKRFEFSPPPAADDAATRKIEGDLTMDDKTMAELRAVGMKPPVTSQAASPPAVKSTEGSSEHITGSKPLAQSVSPQSSPAPTKVVRKRPATSIFAPPIKKRKV